MGGGLVVHASGSAPIRTLVGGSLLHSSVYSVCDEMEYKGGWGRGIVTKMLALETRGLCSVPSTHVQKPG